MRILFFTLLFIGSALSVTKADNQVTLTQNKALFSWQLLEQGYVVIIHGFQETTVEINGFGEGRIILSDSKGNIYVDQPCGLPDTHTFDYSNFQSGSYDLRVERSTGELIDEIRNVFIVQ